MLADACHNNDCKMNSQGSIPPMNLLSTVAFHKQSNGNDNEIDMQNLLSLSHMTLSIKPCDLELDDIKNE